MPKAACELGRDSQLADSFPAWKRPLDFSCSQDWMAADSPSHVFCFDLGDKYHIFDQFRFIMSCI